MTCGNMQGLWKGNKGKKFDMLFGSQWYGQFERQGIRWFLKGHKLIMETLKKNLSTLLRNDSEEKNKRFQITLYD